jgi:hypothetical protein
LVPGGGDASFEQLPAAAGPSDIQARLTAQKLSEHLGEQFYVGLRGRNTEPRGELQNMYVSGYCPLLGQPRTRTLREAR